MVKIKRKKMRGIRGKLWVRILNTFLVPFVLLRHPMATGPSPPISADPMVSFFNSIQIWPTNFLFYGVMEWPGKICAKTKINIRVLFDFKKCIYLFTF